MKNHLLIIGYPNTGKSTLVSQFAPEYLWVDMDARGEEQLGNILGKAHFINSLDVADIVQKMGALTPKLKGKIGSVIYDSVTTLLDPELAIGRIQADRKIGNMNDVNRLKADMLRALRGAALQFGCSTFYIAHLEDGSMSGKAKTRTTISKLEIDRLKSVLNGVIVVFNEGGKRGIKIDWCRYNDNCAAGQVLWDTEGMWRGMPERLSTFMREYKGTEKYNGNVYSLEWLRKYLAEKGKEYPDVGGMKADLGIETEPFWFDRAAWASLIQKAGV